MQIYPGSEALTGRLPGESGGEKDVLNDQSHRRDELIGPQPHLGHFRTLQWGWVGFVFGGEVGAGGESRPQSWDLNLGMSALVPALCPVHHRGPLEYFSPRQERWLTSALNNYLRKERHQPGMVPLPIHTEAPRKAQGPFLAKIHNLCLRFAICFLYVSCPFFCPSVSLLLPFPLSGFFSSAPF